MRAVSRRGFLALLAGAAAAVGLSLVRGWRGSRSVDGLDTVLELNASTTRIGRQYLRRVPEEADAARLRELLESGLGREPWFGGGIRTLIGERVKQDFAEGRVVRLGQWILSETEARLCALTLLAHQDGR